MPPKMFQLAQSPLMQLFAMLTGQGGSPGASPPTPTDAPAAQGQPPVQNNMADLFNTMTQSQERINSANLNAVFGPPSSNIHRRTISGKAEGSPEPQGLDALYDMNPHLAPGNFKSPTDPARFNTAVWGDPNGRQIAPPAQGTMMTKDGPREMSGSEIFGQMAELERPPDMQLPGGGFMGMYGTGSATTGGQGQGGTTINNGVQTPLAAFLAGANNLPPGVPSTNYQQGLSPEQKLRLLGHPSFGLPQPAAPRFRF